MYSSTHTYAETAKSLEKKAVEYLEASKESAKKTSECSHEQDELSYAYSITSEKYADASKVYAKASKVHAFASTTEEKDAWRQACTEALNSCAEVSTQVKNAKKHETDTLYGTKVYYLVYAEEAVKLATKALKTADIEDASATEIATEDLKSALKVAAKLKLEADEALKELTSLEETD